MAVSANGARAYADLLRQLDRRQHGERSSPNKV